MSPKTDDFERKLLATFQAEAREHIQALSSGLIALEQGPGSERRVEIMEAIFREAHSLKGASRAVNQLEIERVCQSLETVFSRMKSGAVSLSPELLDLLHKATGALSNLLASVGAPPGSSEKGLIAQLARELEAGAQGQLSGSTAEESARPRPIAAVPVARSLPTAAEVTPPQEMVRIRAARLDSLLLQAEELLSAKLATRQRATELRNLRAAFAAWEREWAGMEPILRSLRVQPAPNGAHNGARQQEMGAKRLREFLKWNCGFVKSIENSLDSAAGSAEQDHRLVSGMVDSLLADAKRACMLPLSSLLEIFPKLVRDLSRSQGKLVDWASQGEDVYVDRRILQEMREPLIHLVRNCIDHGIEAPEERKRKNKPPRGKVSVAVSQQGDRNVEILVSDDGSGIDTAEVRQTAVKLGLVSPEDAAALDEQRVLSFLFHSGVSTSPIITDISGRGLGLAIVREKVERLGGTVVVASWDAGTSFRIVLPLTLATLRGILVRLDGRPFVLSVVHVERVLRVRKEEIQTVGNRATIEQDGQAVSLVELRTVLELPSTAGSGRQEASTPAVVLASGGIRVAFLVEEVCGEQDVLVKSLGPQFSPLRNIAGATVLGTGEVAPILNVPDLMKSAVGLSAGPAASVPPAEQEDVPRKSFLIAEDSITTRTLLQDILESNGYRVKTAADGAEALETLQAEPFDLVISDVEMPRMTGFDLTTTIRADKKLSAVPVVLVTGLETRQDRDRGIGLGANAYIAKSSFDQAHLMEVVRRLI